jgi:hypothetical protein
VYEEGLFDVRWNAGDIPEPVLHASAIARISEMCDGPSIPCEDEPTIRTVGCLMPLEPTHHEAATGYSLRVNKPPPPNGEFSDPPTFPAQAPYAGTLQLHGCHHMSGAVYYRLLYAYEGASEVPFTGLEWWPPRLQPGFPFHAIPDGDGWYEVLPEGQLVFPHWLLNWPSGAYANGTYVVRLELGDGGKSHITYSDPVAFTIDNRAPNSGITQIRWRAQGGPGCLRMCCPGSARQLTVRPGQTSRLSQVVRKRRAFSRRGPVWGCCGGGNPEPVLDPPPDERFDFYHWYVGPGDNAIARVALFTLAHRAPQGSYSFRIDAHTRAFNPSGDGGGPGVDWNTNYEYSHTHPSIGIAVIDA